MRHETSVRQGCQCEDHIVFSVGVRGSQNLLSDWNHLELFLGGLEMMFAATTVMSIRQILIVRLVGLMAKRHEMVQTTESVSVPWIQTLQHHNCSDEQDPRDYGCVDV